MARRARAGISWARWQTFWPDCVPWCVNEWEAGSRVKEGEGGLREVGVMAR